MWSGSRKAYFCGMASSFQQATSLPCLRKARVRPNLRADAIAIGPDMADDADGLALGDLFQDAIDDLGVGFH